MGGRALRRLPGSWGAAAIHGVDQRTRVVPRGDFAKCDPLGKPFAFVQQRCKCSAKRRRASSSAPQAMCVECSAPDDAPYVRPREAVALRAELARLRALRKRGINVATEMQTVSR